MSTDITDLIQQGTKVPSAELADRYQEVVGCSRYESRKALWMAILEGRLSLDSKRRVTPVATDETPRP